MSPLPPMIRRRRLVRLGETQAVNTTIKFKEFLLNTYDELKRLHELSQSGAISDTEYDIMKAALVQRLLQKQEFSTDKVATQQPSIDAPTNKELNFINDPVMTVLGYVFSPFLCLGAIFGLVNCLRGNAHGLIQMLINIILTIISFLILYEGIRTSGQSYQSTPPTGRTIVIGGVPQVLKDYPAK